MKTQLFILSLVLHAAASLSQTPLLDPDFGIAGKATCAFGTYDSVLSNSALQADGKIVATGQYYYQGADAGVNYAVLCRFNSDGTLDDTFGVGGKVALSSEIFPNVSTTALAILDNGKILILGYTTTVFDSTATSDMVLIQLNNDGSPDVGFGNNGYLNVGSWLPSNAMLIQPDQKIVIGGYDREMEDNFAVLRLHPDGASDSSFGLNGLVR